MLGFSKGMKKIKIANDLYKKLNKLANNIEYNKDGSTILYGVYSDFDILSPVSVEIATKYVEFEGDRIGCLTKQTLKAICFTKQGAEKYIEAHSGYLNNPSIQQLGVAVGRSQPELRFIADALTFIFGDK